MAPEVYVSTGAFGRLPVSLVLDICRRHGVTNLELSSGANYTPAMAPGLMAAARGGFRFLLHNYFPTPSEPFVLNLASDDEDTARRSSSLCRRALAMSARLQSPLYSFHAGFAFTAEPDDLGSAQAHLPRTNLVTARKRFVARVRELATIADGHGVGLAIENNVVAPDNVVGGKNRMYLGVTGEDMLSLLDDIARDNVGILLDVGHLKVSAQSLGFDADAAVRKMAPHIKAVHLSDNDGQEDSNRLVRSDSWFWPALAGLPDLASVIFVLEVYRLAPTEVEAQLDIVRQQLAAVAGGVSR